MHDVIIQISEWKRKNPFLPIWFESGFESIQPNDFFFTLAWTPISISINQDLKTYLFSALSETLTVLSLVPSNLAYCNFVEYGSSEKPTRKVVMLLLLEDATGNFLVSSRKLSLAYSYILPSSCIFLYLPKPTLNPLSFTVSFWQSLKLCHFIVGENEPLHTVHKISSKSWWKLWALTF